METKFTSLALEMIKQVINYWEFVVPIAVGHYGFKTIWRIFHQDDLSHEQKKEAISRNRFSKN